MIICHKKKFIFIHIQRTGGSSIINGLKQQLGADLEIISQHGNARSSEKSLLIEFKNYFKFTIVRNPWDRLISWFSLIHKHKTLDDISLMEAFESFIITDEAFKEGNPDFHYNQLDYITDQNGGLLVDKWYRFEHYAHEFKQLHHDLGLIPEKQPHLNGSALSNYQYYYTKLSRKMVAQKCQKDIDFFKYSFQQISTKNKPKIHTL